MKGNSEKRVSSLLYISKNIRSLKDVEYKAYARNKRFWSVLGQLETVSPSPLPAPARRAGDPHTQLAPPPPHPGRPPHLRAARRLAAPLPACVRGSRTESGASERQQRNDSEAGLEEPVSAEEAWGNLTGSGKSEGRGDRRSLQGEACTAAGAQSGPGAVARLCVPPARPREAWRVGSGRPEIVTRPQRCPHGPDGGSIFMAGCVGDGGPSTT